MSNSTQSQQNRVLAALKEGPQTTIDLRHKYDILGVAPRVYELRTVRGYNIQTHWAHDDNPGPGGGRHSVAQYILMPGKLKGGNHEK